MPGLRTALVALLAATQAWSAGAAPSPAELWRAAALNASLLRGEQLGFTLGGVRSEALLRRWPSTTMCRPPTAGGEATCVREWAASQQLAVRAVVTTFARHAAVWWHLEFAAAAAATSGDGVSAQESSPILQDLHPAELSLPVPDVPGPVVLDWSAGSSASPNDFEPHSAVLPPSNSSDSVGLMLPPELQRPVRGWLCCSGMSSDGSIGHDGIKSGGALPFFRLSFADNSAATVAVGWTGAWQANVTRIGGGGGGGTVRLVTGMTTGVHPGSTAWRGLYARLRAGETVRGPSMALLYTDPPGPQQPPSGRAVNSWRPRPC